MKDTNFSHKIAVLGIGNLLLTDEGVGIHVIKALEKTDAVQNALLVDGGTAGLDALYEIGGDIQKLIVVDAVYGGGPPGAVYKFTPEDVVTEEAAFASLHDISFLDLLKIAERTGDRPDRVIFIGVEPSSFDCGMELSEPVKNNFDKIIELVINEINS